MADSLLPGVVEMPRKALADAAHFLLEAARIRPEGVGTILIRSLPGARVTWVAVGNKDMPFLVDSVAAAIASQGIAIDSLVHPIMPVRRDPKGRLTALPPADASGKRESLINLETPRIDARARREGERELTATIEDVRAAVTDWPPMQELMFAEDAARLTGGEGAELLRWLAGGMLTQLGHLTRGRDGKQPQLLGIC